MMTLKILKTHDFIYKIFHEIYLIFSLTRYSVFNIFRYKRNLTFDPGKSRKIGKKLSGRKRLSSLNMTLTLCIRSMKTENNSNKSLLHQATTLSPFHPQYKTELEILILIHIKHDNLHIQTDDLYLALLVHFNHLPWLLNM
jgi:hypothetical protein